MAYKMIFQNEFIVGATTRPKGIKRMNWMGSILKLYQRGRTSTYTKVTLLTSCQPSIDKFIVLSPYTLNDSNIYKYKKGPKYEHTSS